MFGNSELVDFRVLSKFGSGSNFIFVMTKGRQSSALSKSSNVQGCLCFVTLFTEGTPNRSWGKLYLHIKPLTIRSLWIVTKEEQKFRLTLFRSCREEKKKFRRSVVTPFFTGHGCFRPVTCDTGRCYFKTLSGSSSSAVGDPIRNDPLSSLVRPRSRL